MTKKQTKTHMPLLMALTLSLLYIVSLSLSPTLAGMTSGGGTLVKYSPIVESKEVAMYSDEVELNSASEYSPKTMEYKEEYKEVFEKKLGNKLYAYSNETLELIVDKIDAIIEKKLEDDSYSEKTLGQLLALKAIILDVIETNDEVSIDIDAILEI